MSELSINFNKNGYDSFIDYIKAYAIICVLIGHTVTSLDTIGYALWGGMQVPLFVLVQSFHVLKNDTYRMSMERVWKMFKRIVIPFMLVELSIIAFLEMMEFVGLGDTFSKRMLNWGGYGPGSYYPYVYVQLFFIVPIIATFLRKSKPRVACVVSLSICVLLEMLFSIVEFPDYIYRCLFIRYIFLIYLAWIWIKNGIVINKWTIVLSLISLASIIYFEYFYVDDQPFFYLTGWKFHRWPCYFYVSTLLCYAIHYLYRKIHSHEIFNRSVEKIAAASYEIFLMQMAITSILPSSEIFTNTRFKLLFLAFKFITIWIVSIYGGFYLNLLFKKIYKS